MKRASDGRACLNLRHTQTAVADVAVRALHHRRNAASFHDRMVDRAHRHPHRETPLRFARHARPLSRAVDDRPREIFEKPNLQSGDAARLARNHFRGDRLRHSARWHDHFFIPRRERIVAASIEQPRGNSCCNLAIRSDVDRGQVLQILADRISAFRFLLSAFCCA